MFTAKFFRYACILFPHCSHGNEQFADVSQIPDYLPSPKNEESEEVNLSKPSKSWQLRSFKKRIKFGFISQCYRSLIRLIKHFFAVILEKLLRKFGCRNLSILLVIIFFFMLVWMQVMIRNTVDVDKSKMPRNIREVNKFPTEDIELFGNTLIKKTRLTTQKTSEEKLNFDEKLSDESNRFEENDESSKKIEVDFIKLKIEKANKEQIIYNENIFGPLNNDSLVILVQVHNRVFYLEHLIDSLAKSGNIDQALLIFSHDIYDEEMNDLIKTIKFCKVMQIFFPYSIQTHPGIFPGTDFRDCPRDIGKQKALQIGCLNAKHPDKYGHYREAKFTQIKHHWWWKMNHVFNHLNITSKYSGFVLFLEEDHYVAGDFIHVLRLMGRQCETNKTLCEFLGLGLDIIESGPSNQATISLFQTNLGLAFNRETYLNSIKSCAREFCEFDDYNWDWSLNYITNKCGKDPKLSMILMAQRVFHIGECGTHIRNLNCDTGKVLADIHNRIKSLGLYPTNIVLLENNTVMPRIMENGGWGDTRDHELCINMTHMS